MLGGDAGEGEPTGGPFVLDLKTYTWSVLRCDGELPRGTVGHCSAAVDARVYVFGGFDPHSDHRAPAQARQIPRVPRLHAHVYRLQPNAIQAATLYTTQAYQNVLSVLSFDPQGQQLPRWEVLVSDAQAGQHRVKARRPGSGRAGLLRLEEPSAHGGPLSSRAGLRPRMVQPLRGSLEPKRGAA